MRRGERATASIRSGPVDPTTHTSVRSAVPTPFQTEGRDAQRVVGSGVFRGDSLSINYGDGAVDRLFAEFVDRASQ